MLFSFKLITICDPSLEVFFSSYSCKKQNTILSLTRLKSPVKVDFFIEKTNKSSKKNMCPNMVHVRPRLKMQVKLYNCNRGKFYIPSVYPSRKQWVIMNNRKKKRQLSEYYSWTNVEHRNLRIVDFLFLIASVSYSLVMYLSIWFSIRHEGSWSE